MSINLNIHPPEGSPRKLIKGFGKYKMVYTINDMNQEDKHYKQLNERAPNTVPNGPVVNRTIPLPVEAVNRTIPLPVGDSMPLTKADSLYRVGSEGVVNPAFVTSMDSINIEGNTWSDTSSDNVKDPLSSRASTLTREVQEIQDVANSRSSTLTRDDKGSDEKTNDESNNNNGRYYEPLNDLREQKSTQDTDKKFTGVKPWDVFRITPRDRFKATPGSYMNLLTKIVKVITSIFLTLFILTSTIVSKSALLLITSNMYTNVTLDCEKADVLGHVKSCRRVPPDEPPKPTFIPSQNVEVRWVWAALMVVCVPYIFTMSKCIWRVCFKKTRQPTMSVLLIVLVVESLHTIGLCIFVFYVLPNMDPLRGILLTFGAAFVPSILKMFDNQRQSGRKLYILLADVTAMLFQLTVLLLWPIRNILKGENYEEAWGIFVSFLLISIGWWENYINKFTTLGRIGVTLKDLKRNIRRMRTKIYAVVGIWKIILSFSLMTAMMSNFQLSCVKVLFFLGDNMASECPHFSSLQGGAIKAVEGGSMMYDPFWIVLIQVLSCLLCYTFSKTACKIMLQVVSFALPLMMAMPILVGLTIGECETWKQNNGTSPLVMPDYLYWTCDVHGISHNFLDTLVSEYYLPLTIGWWLSFMWVTFHIWMPRVERLVQTERLFVQPLYCGVMLEQSLMLNRRRDDRDRDISRGSDKQKDRAKFNAYANAGGHNGIIMPGRSSLKTDTTPMIYVCATMWHEVEKEMIQFLTSLFRLDTDQCARKNAQKFFDVVDPDYYEFEAHIFFDNAFEKHDDDEYEYHVNSFVKQLIRVMDTAASKVHRITMKIPPPTKYPTPYGGRLEWTLPGNNKLNVHLKDNMKIRHKKRWSQVMYMYYLLGYKLVAQPLDARRKQTMADNTYILTLDGDVDFKPSAVQLLVDRMRKNEKVGAACGRIHPVGTGPMIWYQKFEYAVSHWLQKATEHMIGCVLCSPGCFSLFRASSLMDDNVMRKYATMSSNARHYVQFDQGEDRWLCTLLLQQGYRVEYSAAADALTYAPEGFDEFYNQRRRWSPSTMANIMDLLGDWKNVIRLNENISFLYIIYQLLLFLSSIITPGTIFLLIVGALNSAFKIDLLTSLFINLVPVLLYLIACFVTTSKWQLRLAGVLSLIYAMVMMVVVVGLGLEMKREGTCSPTTIFLIFVVGIFIVAAVIHPREFYCLLHGALYLLAIPSMSMLLMIYSICNLHVVSWGTRENAVAANPAEKLKPKSTKEKIASIFNRLKSKDDGTDSDYAFSFGNLFKCFCCPKSKSDKTDEKFAAILEKLEALEQTLFEGKDGLESPTLKTENENSDDLLKPGNGLEKKKDSSIRYNPLYETKALPQEDETPFWIHDMDLGHGKIRYIGKEEKLFWKDLVRKYLFPLENDESRQKQMQQELVMLRNKMCLMFFMMNALFIVIIFALQYSNATDKGTGLSIPLPCNDLDTGKPLSLEPISLLFMSVFGIALLIQFIAMFFHRLATFLHIMSSTEVNCMKPNQNEITAMDIASKVQLVKEMQSFVDDDDTRSISTVGSDIDEDSSMTQDDTPKMKRKKTVIRLTRRKRQQQHHAGSLGGKFLRNFLEMAKDLEKEENGNDKYSSPKSRESKKSKNSDKKRSKKALKAMEALEQNKESVLTKAEAIRDRWHRLTTKASKPDSRDRDSGGGDKWGSLLRSVVGQSRSNLNTISEDEKRNTWLRGVMRMNRSSSEFSLNTLPDLGSLSARNSYAEPILNIISDEPIPTSHIGVINNGNRDHEMKVILEKAESKENIYETADGFRNSDSETDSEEESDVSSSKQSTSNDFQMKQMGNPSDLSEHAGDTQL